MIDGFEEYTHELTKKELALVDGFVSAFKHKIGKSNAISNAEIRRRYKEQGIIIHESRVRKIINHLRISGLVPRLIATNNGYCVAETPKELADYVVSVGQRAREIRRLEIEMGKQLQMWGQGKLL